MKAVIPLDEGIDIELCQYTDMTSVCHIILRTGKRVGQQCGARSVPGTQYCGRHQNGVVRPVVMSVVTKANAPASVTIKKETTIEDLPAVVLELIADKLTTGCDEKWKTSLDVARCASSLAMTCNTQMAMLAHEIQMKLDPSYPRPTNASRSKCLISPDMRRRLKACKKDFITATTAKKEYGLSETELGDIPCKLARNPHGRCAPPMRLYFITDVMGAVKRKYGSHKGYEAHKQKLHDAKKASAAAASERRQQREQRIGSMIQASGASVAVDAIRSYLEGNVYDDYVNGGRGAAKTVVETLIAQGQRYMQLEALLHERGCELRDDSRLCRAYIAEGHGQPAEIADIMQEMAFYFSYTGYDDILSELVRNEIHMSGEWLSREEIQDIRDEESEHAKQAALDAFCKRFTDVATAAQQQYVPNGIRQTLLLRAAKEYHQSTLDRIKTEVWPTEPELWSQVLNELNITQPVKDSVVSVELYNTWRSKFDEISDAVRSIRARYENVRENVLKWLQEDHGVQPGDVHIKNSDYMKLTRETLGAELPRLQQSRSLQLEYAAQKRCLQDLLRQVDKSWRGCCPACKDTKRQFDAGGLKSHAAAKHAFL